MIYIGIIRGYICIQKVSQNYVGVGTILPQYLLPILHFQYKFQIVIPEI